VTGILSEKGEDLNIAIETIFKCLTAFPETLAISVSLEKTYGTVRGFGLKSVLWLPLEF